MCVNAGGTAGLIFVLLVPGIFFTIFLGTYFYFRIKTGGMLYVQNLVL